MIEYVKINNNNDVLNYTIPKIFYLYYVYKKIEREKILEQHILYTNFEILKNASDKVDFNKKLKKYNEIIEMFKI